MSFYEGLQIVQTRWKSKPGFKAFKEANLEILAFLTRHESLICFCTDLTLIGALSREQEAWLVYEYYPKVYKLLYADFFLAVVFSEGHFKAIVSHYQLERVQVIHEYLKINYFTDADEALHWLHNVQKGQDAGLLHPDLL
ncbi:hypothetical protein [Pontibacter harenae]|uniref:hypothetical protein n=1 Tax=Pontibacter harenae TaxID=2894083 RepID=UPI001E3CE0F7|nr:hypothetical protein [Pontibacter harenae]MCC9167477.1 hypothetical protein [Pontibacter harenae]